MNPTKYQTLQAIIEDLLEKKHTQPSLSPCAIPTLLAPKKNGSW